MLDLNIQINTPEKDKIEIPTFIIDGLKEKYVLRNYQQEAIKRFIYYIRNKDFYQNQIQNKEFVERWNKNHLLFNIATGGGKTLLMAFIILYLHKEYNYNNFLFLSHLNSINTKTKENFFNKSSSKYLFNENIRINEVNNFNSFNNNEINIMINTYQGITSLLNGVKENSFNLEDIKDKKIVILADESHHLNVNIDSKGGEWENSVYRILNSNKDNFLFEWTATIKWEREEFRNKYLNKCIYKYDLKNFYENGWTKNINLLQRIVDKENLMFGAVILNKYREILFNKEINKNIKPVILFKSKTIEESKNNHIFFNEIINNLNDNYINNYLNNLEDNSIIKVALNYLINEYKNNLSNILKTDFRNENIINTNKDEEIEKNAILLNTLEDKNNNKRVIFSVDKLNEGWDVLNLFDIVKLYETQSTSETVQEAQLIGRGARYCFFEYDNKEKYKRKFNGIEEKSILEQLYFHSKQDNMAIGKLKKELEKNGIVIREVEKIEIKAKEKIYNKILDKKIFHNKKTEKSLFSEKYNIWNDIKKLSSKSIYLINSNKEISINLMDDKEIINKTYNLDNTYLLKLNEIDYNIKREAVINNENYNFEEIYKRLNINNFYEFIKLLDIYGIQVKNFIKNNENEYRIYTAFLNDIYKKIISKQLKEYEGTNIFTPILASKLFKKEYIFDKDEEEIYNTNNYDYYLYNQGQLTSEEKSFIEFFNLKIYRKLKDKFEEIYLIRNEKELKLYNFNDGVGFEPDFILLLKKGNVEYNVYIEPKGNHLLKQDEWKNEFLKEITKLTKENKLKIDNMKDGIEVFENENYKILGFQLYNKNLEDTENRMEKEFEELSK